MNSSWAKATLRRHRRRRGPVLGGGHRPALLRARVQGERGATLVIALGFMIFFALLGTMVLGYAYGQMPFSRATGQQATQYYNTDGALDTAVNLVRNDPNYGVDPTYQTDPNYAPGGSKDCVFTVPGQNEAPDVTVSCAAVPVDPDNPGQIPSGKQDQTGIAPPAAITTLGQARDYYGQINYWSWPWDQVDGHQPRAPECNGVQSDEVGIRGQQFTSTGFLACSGLNGQAQPQGPLGVVKVQGDIGTNSPIWLGTTSNVPGVPNPTLSMIPLPDGSNPVVVVRARADDAACTLSAVTGAAGCTKWTYGAADTSPGQQWTELTRDPYYQPRADGCATCSISNHYPQSFVTDPATGQSSPPAQPGAEAYNAGTDPYPSYRFLNWNTPAVPSCNATGATKFFPGVYTNLTALNNLFASCDHAYWFQPGVYYFNFNNGATSTACDPAGASRNEWCVPGRNTWIVGGTPYGWDPNATSGQSSTSILQLSPAGNVIPLLGGIFGLEWNGDTPTKAASIDGTYAQGSPSAFGLSQIQLTGFPVVQAGSYGGPVNVKVQHYETGPQYNPTIQVGYNGYNTPFGPVSSQVCGTFIVPKSGSATQFQLSAAQQAQLGSCLNTGDKLSRVYVNYATSASWLDAWFGGPQDYLDGVEVDVGQIVNQPKVPGPTDPAKGDPGGNCDPDQPGVQFIFGGESHLVMSGAAGGAGSGSGYASLELCAGPDIGLQTDGSGNAVPLNSKPQIAVFGVPGVQPISPTSAVQAGSSSGGASVSNINNAVVLGEPGGQAVAALHDPGCSNFTGCDTHTDVTLTFPKYTPPAGYKVDSVSLVVGYNTSPNNFLGVPIDQPHYFVNGGCDSGTLPNGAGSNGPDGIAIRQFDITGCLGANLSGFVGSGNFTVTWQDWCHCGLPLWIPAPGDGWLDGAVVVPHVVPVSASAHLLTPATGCRTLLPNYWNGQGTGWAGPATSITPDLGVAGGNDCALIRSGLPGSSNQQGRLSVKGTVYAPSDSIDLSEWANQYSVFNRGVIVRHLTIRNYYPCSIQSGQTWYTGGFTDPNQQICTAGAIDPFASNTLDTGTAPRNVQFVACIKASGATATTRACGATPGDKILGTAAVLFKGSSDTNQIGPTDQLTELLGKVAENTPIVENWNIRY